MICQDCNRYVIPPQRYDPETIEICRCLEIRDCKDITPVRPMKIATELEDAIIKLVNNEDARKPYVAEQIPKFEFYTEKKRFNPLKSIINLITI